MVRNIWISAAIALLLSFALPSCIGEEPMDIEDIVVAGSTLPDFEVEMNDGSTITSEQLRTTTSVVMFFHTGCPDCQQALPRMQRLYDTYHRQGVQFALISREDGATSVAAYWQESGFTMPYSAQEDRTIYELFARKRVPRIYISNDCGVIKSLFTDNPVPTYEALEAALATLL